MRGLSAQVDEAAEKSPAIDTALRIRKRDKRVAGQVLAAAIAYRLFLWILPLSLVLSALLGFLSAGTSEDTADDLGLSAYVASSVASASQQAERSRWIVLIIGLVALYSASAGAARTMAVVYALAWDDEQPLSGASPRQALGFTGVGVACVALTFAAHVVQDSGVVRVVLGELVVLAAVGGLGLLVGVGLPHRGVPWTGLMPGALLIAGGVVVLRVVTAVYIVGKVQSSSELYGALGAAATVLLWLYLVARLLVGAAVLNAALWARQHDGDRRAGS